MSNPVITRLGINQFWYKYWYSDKLFSTNLHQDRLFETLVQFYLDYGLTYHDNIFTHEYWYKPDMKLFRLKTQITNKNFFRRFFYSNTILSIEHSYLIRNKTEEYFPMRLWFLKYANWVIITVQWFKPVKSKSQSKYKINRFVTSSTSIHKHGKQQTSVNRIKYATLIFLNKLQITQKNYKF